MKTVQFIDVIKHN